MGDIRSGQHNPGPLPLNKKGKNIQKRKIIYRRRGASNVYKITAKFFKRKPFGLSSVSF
jgi:hypothetical protein